MVTKYIISCLMLTFVKGTVSDISLDYYFGTGDNLRTVHRLLDCNTNTAQETCQAKCGPNHACLLGKCFCVGVKPQIEKESTSYLFASTELQKSEVRLITQASNNCDSLRTKFRVLEEFLHKIRKVTKKRKDPPSYRNSNFKKLKPEVHRSNNTRLDFMALRPTLRHHIAHFCPNLDVARQCIRKCMALHKPAFCGKDHVCYCGHRYHPNHNENDTTGDDYIPFADLYEKYFGPRFAPTTVSTTTPAPQNIASSEKTSIENEGSGENTNESEKDSQGTEGDSNNKSGNGNNLENTSTGNEGSGEENTNQNNNELKEENTSTGNAGSGDKNTNQNSNELKKENTSTGNAGSGDKNTNQNSDVLQSENTSTGNAGSGDKNTNQNSDELQVENTDTGNAGSGDEDAKTSSKELDNTGTDNQGTEND